MKKLKSHRKIRIVALVRAKFQKKLRQRNEGVSTADRLSRRRLRVFNIRQTELPEPHRISLPNWLSFDTHAMELLNWVRDFRVTSKDPNVPIICDFVPITHVGIAAALVVTAELDNWRLQQFKNEDSKKRLIPVELESWPQEVKAIFFQLGLFKILKVKGANDLRIKNVPAKLEVLRFISGKNCEGQQAEGLFKWFKRQGVDIKSARTPLGVSIREAMSNVWEHAYLGMQTKNVRLINNWWMSASFDRSSKVLEVLLYDRGVTIPASFKYRLMWQRIISIFSPINDAKIICYAMESGKSVTGQRHRGHGLSDMKKAVENGQIPKSRLRIISGYGACTVTPLKPILMEVFETPLPGTLLNWRLELD